MTTEAIRPVEDTTNKPVVYVSGEQEVKLTLNNVRQYFCPMATQEEAALFMMVCASHKLNPWLKDAHLIKYAKDQPASIVVGKDFFVKRASENPNLRSWQSGIIVQRDNTVIEVEGSFKLTTDKLLGGWFKGHRADWSHAFISRVSMEEYNKRQANWQSMPATMIRKVALVQGLREMFPDEYRGLYDSAELPDIKIDSDGDVVDTSPGVIAESTVDLSIPTEAAGEQDAGAAIDGGGWFYGEKFQSYSRRTADNQFQTLGNWLLDRAASMGVSREDLNADLKRRFAVTSSKVSPTQVLEWIDSRLNQESEIDRTMEIRIVDDSDPEES